MRAEARTLYLIALVAVALAAPYLMAEAPPESADAATPAAAADPDAGLGVEAAEADAKPAPEQPPAAPPAKRKVYRLETPHFVADVSDLSGGLAHVSLMDRKYHEPEPVDVVTTDKERFLPLAVELDGADLGTGPWQVDRLSPGALRLTREHDGVRVVRKIEAGDGPFQLWLTTRVTNEGTSPRKLQLHLSTYHYVTREAETGAIPLLPVRSPAISNGLCRHPDDLMREPYKALWEGQDQGGGFHGLEQRGPITFTGVENVYFLAAVASDENDTAACRIGVSPRGGTDEGDRIGSLFAARLSHKEVELPPGGSHTHRDLAYLGPKTPDELTLAGHSMREAIQTGWFTSLAELLTWTLRRIYDVIGNWGLAIILLTVVVKLLLFPLTAKQMQSMARMKELKPEMDRINELYADDREKKGAAVMELYRKRGVNPMAGCFPVLLQLPIWFSLYTSLATNVELFRAPFALWWKDLSSPDPLFFLPIALGALMFVQQKMSPATGTDPMQQKMMLYMMPTMITSFMLFLPAGLCLYMFTNSALSIGQQRLIEARLRKVAPSTPDDSASTSSSEDSTSDAADAAGGRSSKSPRASKPKRRSRRARK